MGSEELIITAPDRLVGEGAAWEGKSKQEDVCVIKTRRGITLYIVEWCFTN
jgi:hypothetical protein